MPGYLYGRVPLDLLQEGMERACRWFDRASEEDKAILAEIYQDECDVIREMNRLMKEADPATGEQEVGLMETLLRVLNDYLARPEMERKTFFL